MESSTNSSLLLSRFVKKEPVEILPGFTISYEWKREDETGEPVESGHSSSTTLIKSEPMDETPQINNPSTVKTEQIPTTDNNDDCYPILAGFTVKSTNSQNVQKLKIYSRNFEAERLPVEKSVGQHMYPEEDNSEQYEGSLANLPVGYYCEQVVSNVNVNHDRTQESPISTTTSSATPSYKSTHQSYVELITQAILSSPEQRLLLSEIYDWMVANVASFKDQRHLHSSLGWKNSVRHNLSLHARFKRVKRNGMDKPSWWTVDFSGEAKRKRSKKSSQPRPMVNITMATSGDIQNQRLEEGQLPVQGLTGASFGYGQSHIPRHSDMGHQNIIID